MNIYEKLLKTQVELKAPKGQYNNFGKYKYRSCEDILEALKPVLNNNKLALFISDSVKTENGRNYIQAKVTLVNIENAEEQIEVTALAREEETKKGMDGSQITGASSSYARKYALNGLFAIDDTKDSDGTNTNEKEENKKTTKKKELSDDEKKQKAIKMITESIKEEDDVFLEAIFKEYGRNHLGECTTEELKDIYKRLRERHS